MRCPFCKANDTKVVDSRLANEGEQVRRRRECAACGARFTSFETAELSMPRIIKSDDAREDFSEGKLLAGMHRALEKRRVPSASIDTAINNIKRKLLAWGEREIASRELGRMVMEELRELDHVAYIRFASVYLSFADLSAFREIINNLEREIRARDKL